MKHIFIVNPAAGKFDATNTVTELLKKAKLNIDYEIYTTKCSGDATIYINDLLKSSDGEFRFYSCGGDGTLNEVINGAAGFSNASVTVFPCGSGNDYIKYYGTAEDFSDIKSLVDAPSEKVDLLKIGSKYAINAVHFGFDSYVLKTMLKVKRKAIIGNNAYGVGVAAGLFFGMKTKCKIKADGNRLSGDKILLCTLCNGKYVGGSYKTAPKSSNSDGFIEVLKINPISRPGFLKLMNVYKDGKHLDDKRFEKYMDYSRAQKIEISADYELPISVDGELIFKQNAVVEIVKGGINFAVPASLSEKNKEKFALKS